jgi:hypothetical protein
MHSILTKAQAKKSAEKKRAMMAGLQRIEAPNLRVGKKQKRKKESK